MDSTHTFNPRSDAPNPRARPGMGDDIPCEKCGGALDTGLECTECGHDNWQAVTGKPREAHSCLPASVLAHCQGRGPALEAADSEGGEL